MKQLLRKMLPIWFAAVVFVLTPLARADGLLAIDNPANSKNGVGLYANLEAFQGNDAVAIRQYGKDWNGSYSPRDGNNIGILAARAETGAYWNGVQLGALFRAQALVVANRDTTDLARQFNTSAGYDTGRNYQLNYALKGFEAQGVRLSKRWQSRVSEQWHLNVGAGLALLQGTQLKLETASGQVISVNAQDFNATAKQDTYSSAINTSGSGDFNPPYGANPALSGQGFAADVGITFQRSDGLRLEVALNDIAGSISWKNVPRYTSDYNTANKFFDSNGYVRFNPAVTAQSSYANIEQTLDTKVLLAVSYPLGPVEAKGVTSFMSGYWFPQVGLSYRAGAFSVMDADYDFRFSTVGISIQHQYIFLKVRTDNLDLDRAKAYGFSFGARAQF